MLHSIPIGEHGAQSGPMTHAIEACVHCGFCLAACPTYRELGQEMDTPRGRIVLMKQVLEGNLAWQAAQPHIDRCLACLACEPACPSGVPYRDLISPFRALAEAKFKRSLGQRFRRFVTAGILPYPNRLRFIAPLSGLVKAAAGLMPGSLKPMVELLPSSPPRAHHWPVVARACGTRRARVGLLLGCAQRVLAPDINTATIDVLTYNGIEVVSPEEQGCCGGLAWHTGNLVQAQCFARQNLRAFPKDLDAIVSNAAGCGSTMQEYSLVLKGTADEAEAVAFAKRVVDVSRFLAQVGLRETPSGFGRPVRVAYHDACHLVNAQGLRGEPRALLGAIPGLELCELPDSDLCCGSAGTYNLDQPALAGALGAKKARAALATGADMLVTGNIGCLMQLRTHLERLQAAKGRVRDHGELQNRQSAQLSGNETQGTPSRVLHTMQLLRDAYGLEAVAGVER